MKNLYLVIVLVLSFVCMLSFAKDISLSDRVKELEKEVVDLQINSLLKKIMISGEFFHTYSRMNATNNSSKPYKYSQRNYVGNIILNFNSTIGKDVNVYTSLYSSFYYGSSVLDPQTPSFQLADSTSGPYVNIIKAYLDYRLMNDWFTFSLGRFSTIYGPPSHLYDMKQRAGTYPLMGYSVPFDGVALTWNINRTFQMKDRLATRFVYAKINRGNPASLNSGLKAEEGTGRIVANSDIMAFMLEYGTDRLKKISSKINIIVQGIYAKFGGMPSMRAYGVLEGQNGITVDHDLYELYSPSNNLLDAYSLVSYLEMNDVAQLPLDAYITFKHIRLVNKGDIHYKVLVDGYGGSGDPLGTSGSLGGYMVDGEDTGTSLLVGGRYKFNNTINLGAEYLMAQVGVLPTTFYTKTSTNFYNTIGKGYHVYCAYSLKANRMNFRFGYRNSLSRGKLGLTQISSSNRRMETIYGHMGITF